LAAALPTKTKPDAKAPSAQHFNNLMFQALMMDNRRVKVNSGQLVYLAVFQTIGFCLVKPWAKAFLYLD
jgi:hypothetical protein